ncbi:TadE/TadG family type IV pilus assembly protein [Salinisphaera aquimarina]|uniref:TadE/TadG family type IV pilus assembly protein n=1 Tax=Salinisphaera aquimarina TaxID=2094031 RepID=A0ABV7EWW5_9GAMM
MRKVALAERVPSGWCQRGASLIEFALVLPVFLLLAVGILFYSIAFATQQAVTYAAQRGADAAVSVSPDVEEFADRARVVAEARIAETLRYFPGVSERSFALQKANCGASAADASEVEASQFCVNSSDADSNRRVVIVRLAPKFRSLWPGFPESGLLGIPEFVRAEGQVVMAASLTKGVGD